MKEYKDREAAIARVASKPRRKTTMKIKTNNEYNNNNNKTPSETNRLLHNLQF